MAKTEERDRRDEDDDDEDDNKKSKKPAKGGASKILLIAGGVALLLVASVLGTFLITRMLEGSHPTATAAAGAPPQPVQAPQPAPAKPQTSNKELYLSLAPAFVVNFQGQNGLRFLQITIEVMAHDSAAIKDVQKYMPHIRNNLVMLLSNQSAADLSTLAGKEKVRAEALAEIQKIMQEETGSPQISAVYFTNFVMQ
ncbi:MAG: flagellar basal body-associated FliL family protein [Acidiferrobacterales bacterium]